MSDPTKPQTLQPWALMKTEPQVYAISLFLPSTSLCGPRGCTVYCPGPVSNKSCSLKFSEGFCWSVSCDYKKGWSRHNIGPHWPSGRKCLYRLTRSNKALERVSGILSLEYHHQLIWVQTHCRMGGRFLHHSCGTIIRAKQGEDP